MSKEDAIEVTATVVATAQGPVVLGFGRFLAGSAQTGAPGFHEYPLPVAV